MPAAKTNTRAKRQQNQIDTALGHMPPQNIEIEKRVLGALMIDVDAFSVVSELLRAETFYDPRHQKIFHAIQQLNVRELPVDIVTVIEELKQEGTHDEVGAPNYIVELSAVSLPRNTLPDSLSTMPATLRERLSMKVRI